MKVQGTTIKVGDSVYNQQRGWGKVCGLDARYGQMPIAVNFPHPVAGFANVVMFNDNDPNLYLTEIISEKQIDEMVDRFLGWKLPSDFAPDCGISFKPEGDYEHPEFGRLKYEPIGTNLFTADQAREMVRHIMGGPTPRIQVPPKAVAWNDGLAGSGNYGD